MHYNWDIARDINIFEENVIPYLRNPIRRGGNPAATPSALADWGYMVTNPDKLTPFGLATRDMEISWSDSVLLALSKRNSSWEQTTIKPLVVIAKYLAQLITHNFQNIYITKSDLAKLMYINDYNKITLEFCYSVLQNEDRFKKPSSREFKYHDIWFNALGETALFFKGKINNVPVMHFNNSTYATSFIKEIAQLGSKISICPIKDNKSDYYLYQGNLTNGIIEILPLFNNPNCASHICPTLCPLSKNKRMLTDNQPLQQIYYGAPGTGKSHTIDDVVTEYNSIRTTFHPDSDYSTFVGCYKPVKKQIPNDYASLNVADFKAMADEINQKTGEKVNLIIDFVSKYAIRLSQLAEETEDIKSLNQLLISFGFHNESYLCKVISKTIEDLKNNADITYEFIPQAFTTAYVNAWKDLDKPYYLVIEEINRGNCAQIFGDIFQLLDRDSESGYSSYKITPDKDLQEYLCKEFAKADIEDEEIKQGIKMQLPSNLNILATMNTSDQSLFPIDSAFKRRWDWKYIPINPNQNKSFILEEKYSWNAFLKIVNDKIESVTLSEDKKMGAWFVKADNKGCISAEKFVSKVVFYLWNDIFKDFSHDGNTIFKDEYKSFHRFFDYDGNVNIEVLKKFLDSFKLTPENSSSTPETHVAPQD